MPDAPLYIVLNAGSGHEDTDTASVASVLSNAGRPHEILRVEDPEHLRDVATQAVAKAKHTNGIVVAAGGDGTLNGVAQIALTPAAFLA